MFRKLVVTFILFALILGAGFFSAMYLKKALDDFFNRRQVVVPDLVGKSLTDAMRLFGGQSGELRIEVGTEQESSAIPRHCIISQEPSAGSVVPERKTILVTVSKGARLREVPDVTGMYLRKARLLLSTVRMKIGQRAVINSSLAERGTVLYQYPAGKAQSSQGDPVDLILSDGRPDVELMPRVTGLTVAEAKDILQKMQVARLTLDEVVSATIPADQILAQVPAPGTPIRTDGTCRLTVCKGNGLLTDDTRKVWVQFDMPPGLTDKQVDVEVTDTLSTRKVYSKVHPPSDPVRVEVTGKGKLTVRWLLDQNPVPVMEQEY